MKKKIVFNCSTNVIGGAVQNAYNFITYAINDTDIDWLFIVSPQVNKQLKTSDIFDDRIIEIKNAPSKSFSSRREIRKLEKEFKPKLVYTMAGPAYVTFQSKHIMGISNPYLTHANIRAFYYGRNLKNSIQTILTVIYQAIYARNANTFFFQTETSREHFCRRYFIDKNDTKIIPNAVGKLFFINQQQQNIIKNSINIFCPAAAYPHKNLKIIPLISKTLDNYLEDYKYKFILTLPKESHMWKKINEYSKKLKISHTIENIGPVDHKDAAKLHSNSDIIFIPSILETLSTSYLEGIASKKPLLVSNLPFATEICSNNAYYFSPYSARSAADKLKYIIENIQQIKKEKEKLSFDSGQYSNQEERFLLIKTELLKSLNQ